MRKLKNKFGHTFALILTIISITISSIIFLTSCGGKSNNKNKKSSIEEINHKLAQKDPDYFYNMGMKFYRDGYYRTAILYFNMDKKYVDGDFTNTLDNYCILLSYYYLRNTDSTRIFSKILIETPKDYFIAFTNMYSDTNWKVYLDINPSSQIDTVLLFTHADILYKLNKNELADLFINKLDNDFESLKSRIISFSD